MITKGQSNFIKLVAISAMLLDHMGAFLYPALIGLRIIGRIVFPLFAYQLTIGYSMTSSKKKYLERLLLFAFISQIPYYFLASQFRLNILFSLILGIFAILALEKKKYYYFILIIPASFFVEYQIYGLLVILIFHLFKNQFAQLGLFTLATFLYALYLFQPIQIFALLSFFIILKPFIEINIPKNFFYIFYPAHLFAIWLIKIVFF